MPSLPGAADGLTALLILSRAIAGMEFEWDDRKAALNRRRHGVSFEQAIKAFLDPFGVELIDDRQDYGEERINLIGMCEGVILHVTCTGRAQRIRLISARRATRHEQDHYYRENSA